METLILDLTTLITLVSDICNDKNIKSRFGDLTEWKGKNNNVYNLILDEEIDPVLPKLLEKLKDHKLTTTRLVWDKFVEMITMYGSNSEISILNNLKIEVIDDDISDEFNEITNKQWTDLNKSSFGTAHKKGYTLVTGNIGALKDIMNKNIDLKYIAHRSRCFVGRKFDRNNSIES
jgi:hypothetical protein